MSNNSSPNPRYLALAEVAGRKPRIFNWIKNQNGQQARVSEIYGLNTFNREVMLKKLSRQTFNKLQEIIRYGGKLDVNIANEVAQAVKEWAIEKGATHFCHWFQPQTGLTAEKHDAFLSFDEEGQPLERFGGAQLIQSEPDASSFPSGGRRNTFEARGYTAWDPSSPIFISEGPNGKTLCVPSVFISYHGEALDYKAPLLRSMEAINQSAVAILELFGEAGILRVVPTLGVEQEYFLIDRSYYSLRPDLVNAGRTLIGAKPPKGQQLEDHYFGVIKARVQAFMQEVEYELYKLGIPIKTRHNEVAPNQFETAPIFEEVNLAADHNQMTMELLRSVAQRHQLALLLHEKPFAGINGSGKHNNWSLMDSKGNNLLEPGKTPQQNLQFLVFLVATLQAVYRYAGLLRAGIASSGNDHRLGANEAPPAIISVFLGEQLTGILDAIEQGVDFESGEEEKKITFKISQLPDIIKDNTDRNRTSPFAFTGNKFEFRSVASSASVSIPMTFLNAAVAYSLDTLRLAIQDKLEIGVKFEKAVMDVVRDTIIETKPIRFEGNNYSQEWVEEATRRGLPNLRKTPEALSELVKPDALGLLWRTGIFTFEEAEAQYYVRLERYITDLEIEIETFKEVVKSYILPAAYTQQQMLASSIGALKEILGKDEAVSGQVRKLGEFSAKITTLLLQLDEFIELVETVAGISEPEVKAHAMAEEVLPQMSLVRVTCDALEEIIWDELWLLPKYREMLS
jgi:glutamine synthetase